MTLRLLIDHPALFAAGVAVCAPFYLENASEDEIAALCRTPLWFAHSKSDTIVPVTQTALPLYRALQKAGHTNVHFTLWDKLQDNTGKYRQKDGSPQPYFGHAAWIPVLNDDCTTDLDGTRVCDNGMPVTVWEWVGRQRRAI